MDPRPCAGAHRALLAALPEPASSLGPCGLRSLRGVPFDASLTFDREMILEKTAKRRELAQRSGVRFGRPKALTPKQAQEANAMAEAEAQRHAAEVFGVSVATFKRMKAAAL